MASCFCLSLNTQVNQAESNGWSPLHVSVQRGHLPGIRCLLEAPVPHAREPDRGDGSKAGRRVDEDSNRKNLKKTIPVGYFRFWSYIYIYIYIYQVT